MKFEPETLIQIYLDGAFTEEAQAEFDRLMRNDPQFAEKVTQAVAQRVGPPPEALLSQAEARLDAKMGDLWIAHKPSPTRDLMKKFSTVLAIAVGSGLLCFGYKNLGGKLLSPMVSQPVSHPGDLGQAPPKTLRLAKVEKDATHPSRNSAVRGEVPGDKGGTTGQQDGKVPSVAIEQAGSSPANKDRTGTHPDQARASNTSPISPMGGASSVSSTASAPVRPSLSQEGFPLRLEVETDRKEEVAVTVLDPGGLPVRSLYRGTLEAGVHFVDWDGLDNAGHALPPGTYTVVLKAGTKVQSGTVTIQPQK